MIVRWLARFVLAFAAMLPSPALAGWVRYDRVITCAAWHVFAAAELSLVDKKGNKKEIKQHEYDAGFQLDMATSLMDRPGVSRAQAMADIHVRYAEMIDAHRNGTSLDEINAKGDAVCHHLSDDD
ncbi:MAG: hypothetical protein U1E37_02900 [Sphingomonadaceae bacterium]|mgnify:CR=1 FL=1